MRKFSELVGHNQQYWYRVLDCVVIDADTVDLTIDLGFQINYKDRFRLYGPDFDQEMGLDAPERYTPLGKEATNYLRTRITEAIVADHMILARTVKDRKEKYGRYLVVLFVCMGGDEFNNLNKELIDKGYASLKKY